MIAGLIIIGAILLLSVGLFVIGMSAEDNE